MANMEGLITANAVAEKLGVCTRTLWRMVKRGQVPPPIRFNRKLVRWRATQIDEYIRTAGKNPEGRVTRNAATE
jgi:predicted DNA-binding transcriptional regulator AlpA